MVATHLKPSQLARQCGINIETLRYYEKRELLDPPLRTPKGYRLYTEADAVKIRFIKNAQRLGFTLTEISELLKLRVQAGMACDPVLRKTEAKLEEVERKIKDLKSMRKVLKDLTVTCRNKSPTSHCPVLESFEAGKRKD